MRSLPTTALALTLVGCSSPLVPLDGSGSQPPTWIYGGSSATAARHKAVVALHELEGRQIYVDPFCTGTLIRGDWVLTAAHCIGDFDRDPATLAIYVGKDPSRDLEDHTYDVTEVHVFPGYDDREIVGDLALLRLPGDVADHEGVTPVRELANVDGITNADAGTMVDLVGFGLTESGGGGTRLHVMEELGGLVDAAVARQIWTDQSDGTGTCSGDSGGPLMIQRPGGWRVAGLTSYGDADCMDYGVYTDVDYYESWITGVIEGSDEQPPDDGSEW